MGALLYCPMKHLQIFFTSPMLLHIWIHNECERPLNHISEVILVINLRTVFTFLYYLEYWS